MLSVNTNIASLQAQRSLSQVSGQEHTAMERLSSGKRINSAKDDAAGLFTVEKQLMDIGASRQVDKGLSDGISYTQIAEGALAEIQKLLHRAHEIAVQAANGTVEDSTGLNKEWLQIKAEIDRIAENTEAFGFKPLLGAMGNVPNIGDVLQNGITSNGVSSGIIPMSFIPAGSKNVAVQIAELGLPFTHKLVAITKIRLKLFIT